VENQVASEPVVTDDLNQPVPEAQETTAAPEPVTEEQAKRSFSQEEVDALIQKRLLKEERRVHRRVEQQLREQFERQSAQVEPRREAFASDQAFAEAKIQQIAEQKAAELLARRESEREAAKRLETFEERAEKVADKYPDFDSVARNPALPITQHMAEYIAESDLGPDIAYHLGKNPSLAARIAGLGPMKAAVELSKLERELATPKARASNAPEQITPVGTRGRASTTSSPSDDDDIETWMRKERQRVAKL